MRVAFKNNMTLEQVKTLFKVVLSEGGQVKRGDTGTCKLVTKKGESFLMTFNSNLELRKLI